MLERGPVGVRKVGRFIQRFDSETFQSVEAATRHDKRAHGTGLVGAHDDELQLAITCEDTGAGLHPGELMHGAIRGVGKKGPSLRFTLNRTEFLNNPHGWRHVFN